MQTLITVTKEDKTIFSIKYKWGHQPRPRAWVMETFLNKESEKNVFLFSLFLYINLFFFSYSRFSLVTNFIHISVYMSIPITQYITPPHPRPCCFPLLVSIRLFSTSVSQFLPCKPVYLYHFSRFHMYVLIYGICFSLSDLLHSVWQFLDPSTSQQMNKFHLFLWLSNIPLYTCSISSLSICLSMGI